MRRLAALAAALLAGCGSGSVSPDPSGPSKPGCSCEKKICVCPHCRGPASRCACREVEKPG